MHFYHTRVCSLVTHVNFNESICKVGQHLGLFKESGTIFFCSAILRMVSKYVCVCVYIYIYIRGEGARLSRCHGDLYVAKGLACLGVMATYTWRRGSLVSVSWRPIRGEGARLSRCHGDLYVAKGLACLGVMATYTWRRASLVSVSWRPTRGEGARLSRCHGDLYVAKGIACLGVMATYTW